MNTNENAIAPLLLAGNPFFAGLDAPRLAPIAALCRLQRFAAGDCIYRSGEPARDFYAISAGSVSLSVGYGAREANGASLLRRHDVFGWAALTPSCSQRIATAVCVSDCGLLALDGTALLALMEADHTTGYRLMTRLTSMITGTMSAFAGG